MGTGAARSAGSARGGAWLKLRQAFDDARLFAANPAAFQQNRTRTLSLSPLHLAALHGLLGVVQWLLRAGADADLRDGLNRTAREIAVMRGFVDIAAELAPQPRTGDVSMARFLREQR